MVECELGMLVVNSSKIAVLIDTWWNVNDKDDHKAGAKYKF